MKVLQKSRAWQRRPLRGRPPGAYTVVDFPYDPVYRGPVTCATALEVAQHLYAELQPCVGERLSPQTLGALECVVQRELERIRQGSAHDPTDGIQVQVGEGGGSPDSLLATPPLNQERGKNSMSETYNNLLDLEVKHWDAATLLLTALARHYTELKVPLPASLQPQQGKGVPLEICFTVNGVELPFGPVMERMVELRREEIETRARSLLQDSLATDSIDPLRKLNRTLGDLTEQFEREVQSLGRKVFPLAYIPEEDED